MALGVKVVLDVVAIVEGGGIVRAGHTVVGHAIGAAGTLWIYEDVLAPDPHTSCLEMHVAHIRRHIRRHGEEDDCAQINLRNGSPVPKHKRQRAEQVWEDQCPQSGNRPPLPQQVHSRKIGRLCQKADPKQQDAPPAQSIYQEFHPGSHSMPDPVPACA